MTDDFEQILPTDLRGRHILYAVSTMGLGHVQRSLPLIRSLRRRGAELTVVSHGRALDALRVELAGESNPGIRWIDVPDYPPLQRGRGLAHYLYYGVDLTRLQARIAHEARTLQRLHRETPFDLVMADGRLGWVTAGVPCLLLIHQVQVLLPRGLRVFQRVADALQRRILSRYTSLVIPELPDPALSICGRLAHNPIHTTLPTRWIGPLSTLDPVPSVPAEVQTDLLLVLGGFIEAERRALVQWLRQAMAKHPGLRIGLLLGGGSWAPEDLPTGARVYPMALGPERGQLMAGTRLIVGRTGQTTLMDLRAISGRGLLFPTPGMTEQIELARRIRGFGHRFADPEARRLASLLEELAHSALPPHLRPVRFDATELPTELQRGTTAQSVASFDRLIDEILESTDARAV